jgi:SAM-dependent methyltransferase
MNQASPAIESASGSHWTARNAWTAFWQDPAQSHCVAGAPDIQQRLRAHWASFAAGLAAGTRVLDLGCGAGAVARELVKAKADLLVTGVDFARVPLLLDPHVDLLSDTPMEAMVFAEGSFGAAVSQFGFEYSRTRESARELRRLVVPGGRISLVVHHAESGIVAVNRARLAVITAFLAPSMRSAFMAGEGALFSAQVVSLAAHHPEDSLMAELARAMPPRVARPPRERVAIWNALEDALGPERCLAASLSASAVSRSAMTAWLEPLADVCESLSVTTMLDVQGMPIAWSVEGRRHG